LADGKKDLGGIEHLVVWYEIQSKQPMKKYFILGFASGVLFGATMMYGYNHLKYDSLEQKYFRLGYECSQIYLNK